MIHDHARLREYYAARLKEITCCTRIQVIHCVMRAIDPDHQMSHRYAKGSDAAKAPVWWDPEVAYRNLYLLHDNDITRLVLHSLCDLYDYGVRVEHLEDAIKGQRFSQADREILDQIILVRANEEWHSNPLEPRRVAVGPHSKTEPEWIRAGRLPPVPGPSCRSWF
ncbi:hypothetical protein BJX65DRAFT_291747 [Aspergillus insuetus]